MLPEKPELSPSGSSQGSGSLKCFPSSEIYNYLECPSTIDHG